MSQLKAHIPFTSFGSSWSRSVSQNILFSKRITVVWYSPRSPQRSNRGSLYNELDFSRAMLRGLPSSPSLNHSHDKPVITAWIRYRQSKFIISSAYNVERGASNSRPKDCKDASHSGKLR